MSRLTASGLAKIKTYIKELESKRKEILDAGKDTASETNLPTADDIIADIDQFHSDDEYLNGWGVTDHYEADSPLHLINGTDYLLDGQKAMVNFAMFWECYGRQTVELPDDLDLSDEEKIKEYLLSVWDDIPLPSGDYIHDSDELDMEGGFCIEALEGDA